MERSIRLYIYSTCLETIGTKTLVLGCCQCRLKHVHNGMHSTRKKKSLLHLWMTQHPSGTIAPSSEWLSKQFNRDTRNKITLFVKKNCAELQGILKRVPKTNQIKALNKKESRHFRRLEKGFFCPEKKGHLWEQQKEIPNIPTRKILQGSICR